MRPPMQVADAFEVFPMLDGGALRAAVEKHKPDVIVPEIEAIDTATLAALETEGWRVAPSAKAVQLTMNRDGIRDFAANEVGLVTSKYSFAETREEAIAAATEVGLPCVVKPVMSSSGKGQSTARTTEEVGAAWDYAVANMRGDRPRVIVEEFVDFDSEITLLTVATRDGVLFCAPIGHRQEKGDYRESWQPAAIPAKHSIRPDTRRAKSSRRLAVTASSESNSSFAAIRRYSPNFSPRPHDTGMVTLISQFPNEFELHLRAILGLPIPSIELAGPSASAVILADRETEAFSYGGVAEALALGAPGCPVDVRIFAKPRRSKTAAWASPLPAARASRMRSHAPRAPRRVSASLFTAEGGAHAQDCSPSLASHRSPPAMTAPAAKDRTIRVVSDEQKQLHQLDAFNLAIGLKRAIYDAGYTCKRITDAGYVGTWKNLDMWVAHCVYDKGPAGDWAVFAGPDGGAQVRDCKDITADRDCRIARSASARRAALPTLK